MKNVAATARVAVTTLAMSLACWCVHAAGFQTGLAVDANGKPIQIAIWYPSLATPAPMTLGLTTMAVALNGPVAGRALPLVAISHGNGGSSLSHVDTAIALADAGYVVVAVTHTGDNYADQSRSVFLMDRPKHISRALDHMLSTWDGRAALDPARIGMFGFSSGGFTTLASIGGIADFAKVAANCRDYPGDYACQLIAKSGQANLALPDPAPVHDTRIKAAVVAAPALGFAFSPGGLKNVRIPVQLWRAEDDTILPQPRYAEAVRLALPMAPDYHVVPKAGHFDFLTPCSAGLANAARFICASAPGFDRAAFHTTFNAALVAFFDKNLK